MGRPTDPTRGRRGTGHRPQAGKRPPLESVPDLPDLEGEVLSAVEVRSARKPELRVLAAKFGLDTAGTVAQLRERLLAVADLQPPAAEAVVSSRLAKPDTMSDRAWEVYLLGVEELGPRLREADVPSLFMWATAFARWEQAADQVNVHGVLVEGAMGGLVRNPAVSIEKDMAATFVRLSDVLGLNQAARIRLGLMQLAGETLLQGLNAALDRPALPGS